MEFTNFNEIKAIDEARAKKIIKWYNKTNYGIAIMAGGGRILASSDLIELLSIFDNSTNIEMDFKHLVDEVFEREK